MTHPAQSPTEVTIELDARTAVCTAPNCGGTVVRHSLGGGQSVDRCTRCFRRFRLKSSARTEHAQAGKLRRMFDEFVTWRE